MCTFVGRMCFVYQYQFSGNSLPLLACRSPKRLTVLVEKQKTRARQNFFRRFAAHFQIRSGATENQRRSLQRLHYTWTLNRTLILTLTLTLTHYYDIASACWRSWHSRTLKLSFAQITVIHCTDRWCDICSPDGALQCPATVEYADGSPPRSSADEPCLALLPPSTCCDWQVPERCSWWYPQWQSESRSVALVAASVPSNQTKP